MGLNVCVIFNGTQLWVIVMGKFWCDIFRRNPVGYCDGFKCRCDISGSLWVIVTGLDPSLGLCNPDEHTQMIFNRFITLNIAVESSDIIK